MAYALISQRINDTYRNAAALTYDVTFRRWRYKKKWRQYVNSGIKKKE